MSHSPYHDYSASSSSAGTDINFQDNHRDRSHWSLEEGQHVGRVGLFEKSPGPITHKYEPSIHSNMSEARSQSPYAPWARRGSIPYSESATSLPSYHDNSEARYQDTRKLTSTIRNQLDAGNRARIYLFIAMCVGMLLIFLFAALIWLKLDIIKKKPAYGLDNKISYTVRQSTVV